MANLWRDLSKPIMILAPMEDVTDTVFRRIVASCGRPDLFFTEFVSVDGLCSRGYDSVAKRLVFTPAERPLIAQIWGATPEHYRTAAGLLRELGFDGIDINMGCPDKVVIKRGACSALIRTPPLAAEIIAATRDGAGGLPVSVKTRIGFDEIATEAWLGFLLAQGIDALTVHGRTVKELSLVPAHWDEIAKAVRLRDRMGLATPVIGNGDVNSLDDAEQRIAETGVDGVMIGRGIFRDPWLFNRAHHGADVPFGEKLDKLAEHIALYDRVWGPNRPYAVMKKFFKCYVNGTPGAGELRNRLIAFDTAHQALAELDRIRRSLPAADRRLLTVGG